jgi:hypothetical protein
MALGAAVLAPSMGLASIVPCFVSARRAGERTTPYTIALVVSLVWVGVLALSLAAHSLVQPAHAGPTPV